ncbi:hypothetical protein [Microbacterium sp. P5_E9]
MARIGGRSLWLAWPVGVLCAGIVGALLWVAAPAVPGTVNWIGDTLRAATSAPVAAAPSPVETAALDPATDLDCRTLYPDRLWAELVWGRDVLLSQNFAAPPTGITGLVDALQPVVRVTCSWRSAAGQIVTTLSQVGADASTIADAALRGQGFDCETIGAGVACRRQQGDVIEEQAVRDGLWLASVETSWLPEDYGTQLAARVWG